MPLPDPLPPRFVATLHARVSALFAHGILRGGRQLVEKPSDGGPPLVLRIEGDVGAGTLRLVAFPEVEDAVGTLIGKVRAAVQVGGQPEGSFDAATGRVEIDVPIHLDTRHLLARDSDAVLTLSTHVAVDQPELSAEGDPFHGGDPVVRLVGTGTFEGGSLAGGTLWLVLDAEVQDVEAV